MPNRTIKAGVQQKLSNGDYGSFGAMYETTISFDFEELPSAEQLLALSRQMYGDARHAVAEELARQKAEFLAARPAPVETASQRDERAGAGLAAAHRSNGVYHESDRAIDEARANRPEPRNGDGASTSTRPRRDDRERPDDRRRDDRGRSGERRGGGGRSYGPPTNGKSLLAWARGQDEGGAGGVEKYLKGWGKDQGLSGLWQDWDRRDVDDAYELGTKWIDGDQR